MSDARAGSEADDASRGSAVRLAAELASRLLGFATTFLLLYWLGAAEFGTFGELSTYALLIAELGELGLQALASRALVARTLSLASFVRARLLSAAIAALVALSLIPATHSLAVLTSRLARALFASSQHATADGVTLALLVAWYLLSGWTEFFGVALRCRRRRRLEAALLLVLRAAGLLFAAAALAAGAGLRGAALGLALSPLPAIALGAALLSRAPGPPAPDAPALTVLRESAPLAVHGGLLLLSPRVEFLVLSWVFSGQAIVGMFYAALWVVWLLSAIPSAIVAGAMPALTREALRGDGGVRSRTTATLALFGVPAAVGLALLAPALVAYLPGDGYALADRSGTALALRVIALAVPAMFLNALLAGALIAVGRASWLPRLTASRVLVAFALALALVPRLGALGAAGGFACAEWLLLGGGAIACRSARFGVPVARPLAWGLASCGPMALAVYGLRGSLPLAIPIGVLTWLATLAAALRLAPRSVRQLTGDLRYP